MPGIDFTDITEKKRPLTFGVTPPARTIRAIVGREQPESIPGIQQMNKPQIFITVKNHPIEGICTAATQPAAIGSFEETLQDIADDFLDTFDAETIIYHPASAAGLDTNRDTVEIALQKGGTPETRRITGLVNQDAGMIKLEIG
ncbi:MAG: hypothetical protein ABII09_03590 [Planctomycetota bacterium]